MGGVIDVQKLQQVAWDRPGLEGALIRVKYISGEIDADAQKNAFLGQWQKEGVEFMVRREFDQAGVKGGLMCDDMGLGKTYQIMALMAVNMCRTLILCPVNVLDQWTRELRSFLGVRPFVLMSSWNTAHDIAHDDEMITLVPLSMFSSGNAPDYLYEREYSRIVIDESHLIRNKSTQLFSNVDRLMRGGGARWCVTGTPIQNSLDDLCTLTQWIGITETRNLVTAIKQRYMIRRTIREVMPDLPLLHQRTEMLEFSPTEQKIYDFVENEYGSGPDDPAFVLEAIMRCRQICVSPLIFLQKRAPIQRGRHKPADNFSKYFIDPEDLPPDLKRIIAEADSIPSTKLEWVVEDVLRENTEKCIIFCQWLQEMVILEDMLNQRKVPSVSFHGDMHQSAKNASLRAFDKQTRVRVIIMQINSGGIGLNIQAASRVYILSPAWNPCVETQATARAYRLGQTKPVTVIRVIMKDTVDERCLQVQQRKAATIVDVLDDILLKDRMDDASFQDLKYIFRGKQKKRKAAAAEAAAAAKKQQQQNDT